jgi:hypothetical protein
MAKQSVLEKLQLAPPASFHVLDPAKAARMHARTMFIPAPEDVARAIAAIPRGKTKSIVELRRELAAIGNAETACPAKTILYWKWLAAATEDVLGGESKFSVPWWRVLKDGKPSRHMPGGVEAHVARLKAEGVHLR